MAVADVLVSALRAQISAAAAAWLDDALTRAARGPRTHLPRLYTEASRHLGRTTAVAAAVQADPELRAFPLHHWTADDVGRLLLLLARYDAHGDAEGFATALECYEQGDAREQQSWLRTVALLPQPDRFLATAIDACRSSIVPVFEAIACENTYPAAYFPERNFNQVVLKALFNGVALERIVGLRGRLNADLSRMARDYAAERQAAGRSVPADISLAMLDGVAAQRTE